jgi:hypothetical protein
MTETVSPTPPSPDDVSAKARQAFAQLQPSDVSKSKAAGAKAAPTQTFAVAKEIYVEPCEAPRKMRLARQHQLDWFGARMWW